MNIYRTSFYANCPTNGVRILYSLQISTREIIPVEQIVSAVESISEGFHEEIADELLQKFGGMQKLEAEHHGVHIETLRAEPA